jgi:hypothetical protein
MDILDDPVFRGSVHAHTFIVVGRNWPRAAVHIQAHQAAIAEKVACSPIKVLCNRPPFKVDQKNATTIFSHQGFQSIVGNVRNPATKEISWSRNAARVAVLASSIKTLLLLVHAVVDDITERWRIVFPIHTTRMLIAPVSLSFLLCLTISRPSVIKRLLLFVSGPGIHS